MEKLNNLEIAGARLIYRNFRGEEGMYNAKGDRNFAVIIPTDDMADALIQQGYNVKFPPIREGEEPKRPYLSVNVSYKFKTPRVIVIQNGVQTPITEDGIGSLDFADIENADIILEPSRWTMRGNSGVKPYLKTAYITLEPDRFASKYANLEVNDDLPF